MSKRKTRPPRGTPVPADMSMRDMASALGTTTAWLSRCKRLGEIPDADFEEIVESDGWLRENQTLCADAIINEYLSRCGDTLLPQPRRRTRVCPHCGKAIGWSR